MSKFYVLCEHGEIVFWSTDREEAAWKHRQAIDQRICNFYRYLLPLKVDVQTRNDFSGISLHEIDTEKSGMLVCELQDHFDRYYREAQEQRADDAAREWERAKELYEKFKDRLLAWEARDDVS